MLKPGVSTKVKLYSTLVEEWKATEGMTLGNSTLANYSNALRAYVIPTFADTDIRTITRKTIQDFLVVQAKKYGESALKTMRLVLCMTLSGLSKNGDLQQPNGWLDGIRLPKKFGGRKVDANRTNAGTNAGICLAHERALLDADIAVGFGGLARRGGDWLAAW